MSELASGHHSSSEIALRVRRLEERLIDAGLTSDDQLDAIIGRVSSGSPANGARVVARAWVDPAYRERLLAAGVPEAELNAIDDEVRAAVAEAERVAREAPDPDPAVAMTQLWADGGSSWRS